MDSEVSVAELRRWIAPYWLVRELDAEWTVLEAGAEDVLTPPLPVGASFRAALSPEHAQQLTEQLARHAGTREPFELGPYLLVTVAGEVRAYSELARFEERAARTVLVGALRDSTTRWRSLKSVEERAERLSLVLEGTRLGLWDWYPQTNEVRFDERWAEMLGHRLEEIPQRLSSWEERVHPEDLAACFADITAHMEGRIPYYENVHRMRHADGSWRYILDRGRICERDAAGRPLRFAGTHTDITAQKVAELEARRASLARVRFLATMSHEIRTPLHGMLGMVQLLTDAQASEEQRMHLEHLRHAGELLLAIVNDILDFSKLDSGAMKLEHIPFDARALLVSISGLAQTLARGKGVRVEVEVDPELPVSLRGDPVRFRQIATNLVSNAVKFTSRGAVRISLAASAREARSVWLELSVADDGIGIRPERLPYLFQPFTQADESITRRFGGTGLGLAIVHELVRVFGGTVGLESEFGRGTRFTVRLPFEIDRTERPRTPAVSSVQMPPLRILAAEDNTLNQLVLEAQLRKEAQTVTLVSDGRRAVEACEEAEWDLILLDLHMPELDGLGVARELRARGLQPNAYLALVSADAFAETREQCRLAGIPGYLPKPFHRSALRAVLEAAVARSAVAPGALALRDEHDEG